MRIIRKILFKVLSLVIMVVLMSSAVRYGQRYISKTSGVPQIPGVNFSSEESDLMSTIFKSALRLVSGTAKREELAGELSDKLYAGRAGAGEMSELGIELVKPGGASPVPDSKGATIAANPQPGLPTVKPVTGASAPSGATGVVSSQSVAKLPAKAGAPTADSPAATVDGKSQAALQAKVWEQAKRYSVELGVVPVALLGMYLMHRIRGRRSGAEDFVLANLAMQAPSDSEPYDMKNPLHSMKVEDFELLIALIYQRQGYRVSMPAGLSGGRGIDFTLVRKSERVLVQCKRMNQESRVTIERIRELHDAVTAAGATRGMYIASCGFTWDARNFAKAKGLMVINARTLDELEQNSSKFSEI